MDARTLSRWFLAAALTAGAAGCSAPAARNGKETAAKSPAAAPAPAPALAPVAAGGGASAPAVKSEDSVKGTIAAAAASRPRKKPVFDGTGVLMSPKPLAGQTPAPAYPEASRLAGETGVVVVRVSVSEEGVPVEARVEESSTFPKLDAAAVDAAMRWRFKAGTWQGRAVELDILVPFRFGLKSAQTP
jgi:protein TonB